jgi:hypothetical protein
MGQFGTGLLYLLTVGFFFVGALIDLLKYEITAFKHNKSARCVWI